MANKDLQTLYKMREILEREEYTVSYNRAIDDKYNKDIEYTMIEYDKQKKPKPPVKPSPIIKDKIDIYIGIPGFLLKILLSLVLLAAYVAVTIIMKNEVSDVIFWSDSESSYDYLGTMHVLFTSIWGCALILFIGSCVDGVITRIVLQIGSLAIGIVETIMVFNALELSGDFGGKGDLILAIVLLIFWPIANFIFLFSIESIKIWLLILLNFVIVMVVFAVLSFLISLIDDDDDDIGICIRIRERTEKYKKKDAEKYKLESESFKQKSIVFEQERKVVLENEQKEKHPAYQKLKKSDNYSDDKKSMLGLVSSSMQNLKTINELIWCIEEMYATDIVSARQWCRQEKHFAIMEAGMRSLVSGVHNIATIQKKAVAEADKNAKAMLAAIDRQTKRIDIQTGVIRDQTKKIEDLTDATKEQTGAIKEQTGAIKEQTGVIKDQTKKIEKQTDAIKEQTREINAQTGAIDAQTRAINDQTNTIHRVGNNIERELRNASPPPVIYYKND